MFIQYSYLTVLSQKKVSGKLYLTRYNLLWFIKKGGQLPSPLPSINVNSFSKWMALYKYWLAGKHLIKIGFQWTMIIFGQKSFCIQKILVLFSTKLVFWRAAFTGRKLMTSSRDVDSRRLVVQKVKKTKQKIKQTTKNKCSGFKKTKRSRYRFSWSWWWEIWIEFLGKRKEKVPL